MATIGPMADPILRATDSTGEVYDDPSEDALFMFIEDLETPGAVLVVERTETGREGEFRRVTRLEDGGYGLSGSDLAETVTTRSMRVVHEAMTRWAFDLSEDAPLAGVPDEDEPSFTREDFMNDLRKVSKPDA